MSCFKDSTTLENRKRYANGLKNKYPEKVFVIMERSEHSLVPVLQNSKQIVPANLTVGEVENILRRELNLASEKAMFLFVNNTIPQKDALMSAIFEEQKEEDGFLYLTYSGEDGVTSLLCTMKTSLDILGSIVQEESLDFISYCPETWTRYLRVLKTLVALSESEKGVMEQVEEMIKSRKAALYSLVALFSRVGDQNWVLKLSDCRNFQIRDHFGKLMFVATKEETLDIDIDRSELLDQTISQIADATTIHGDISVSFKSEEAFGDGILLEWFFLISKEIFDPERKLFTLSPDDHRRYRPNPASYVVEDHLKKFKVAGLIIALAIKHGVQVGILLDPIFFLNLAGKSVRLEEVRLTDEIQHQSCSRILEMSEEAFDAMKLTFSVEIEEEKGKMVEISLCEDGENTDVRFKDKDLYIKLRTEYMFVKLVEEQVKNFAQGFEKMLSVDHKVYFNTMKLEDMDVILGGEAHTISIEDWRSHTDYENFEETDRVIEWFWKLVDGMNEEKRQNLLYFWTARKYLPVGGFAKLPERLTIARQFGIGDTDKTYPKSQTCSSQLQIKEYRCIEDMETEFFYITTTPVGFGLT